MAKNSSESEIAGGERPVTARWVIVGEITLETAAHFGGEGDGTVDMMILRDPKDGASLLAGTSLAGALRSHLADVLGGYRSREHPEVARLFGAARGDDEGTQSPLFVFDSLGWIPEGLSAEIRDGVAINPATGTAEAHKKFDFEVLPAGTLFPVRVELIIEEPAQEGRLLGLLIAALDGLTKGDIALGKRRSRGLGAVKARNWKAWRYDLTMAQGWLGWLTSDHLTPIAEDVPRWASAAEAIQTAQPALELQGFEDKRCRVLIELDMELAGDLLVRSPATDPGAPDVVHLHSAGKPVLPGTGLAGALRSQALRIARLVRESKGDGDLWIERIFGPRLEQEGDEDSINNRARASRLRISESFIKNCGMRRQTRIAIDRFTGGVVQGALFDEQLQSGGELQVRLELRVPNDPERSSDAEFGLLLLLFKDLLSGEIPVGGGVSVGRGILGGTAIVHLSDGTQYQIAPDLKVEEEALKHFNVFIEAFHQAKPLEKGEVRS